jgi:hypothetical protein
MEEILEEVRRYDTDTLRAKLAENGVAVGPIAPSCISLFQNRLAKELFRKQGGVLDDLPVDEKETKKILEPLKDVKKEGAVSSNISGVYYAVCLPENVEHEQEGKDKIILGFKN